MAKSKWTGERVFVSLTADNRRVELIPSSSSSSEGKHEASFRPLIKSDSSFAPKVLLPARRSEGSQTRDGSAGQEGRGGRGSFSEEEAAKNLQRGSLLRPAGQIRASDRGGGGGGGGGDSRGEEAEEGGEEEEEEEEVQEVQEERGEGAAVQLALSDGGTAADGLRLLHPHHGGICCGDGGSPGRRQQSMTGQGRIVSHLVRPRCPAVQPRCGGQAGARGHSESVISHMNVLLPSSLNEYLACKTSHCSLKRCLPLPPSVQPAVQTQRPLSSCQKTQAGSSQRLAEASPLSNSTS